MEKDGKIDNPQQWGKSPTRMTSVNVDDRLWSLAKQNFIEFKDALEFGILFKLADKDVGLSFDYPTSKLLQRRDELVERLQEAFKKITDLEIPKKDEDIKAEVDEVFSAEVKKDE